MAPVLGGGPHRALRRGGLVPPLVLFVLGEAASASPPPSGTGLLGATHLLAGVWRWRAGARHRALSLPCRVYLQAPRHAPMSHPRAALHTCSPLHGQGRGLTKPQQQQMPLLKPRLLPKQGARGGGCAVFLGPPRRTSPAFPRGVHKGCGKPQPAGHGAGCRRRVWTAAASACSGALAQPQAVG